MIIGNQLIESIGKDIFFPFDPRRVQPASYDLSLGCSFQRLNESKEHIFSSSPFYLQPGEFALATTMERVEIPNNICIQVDGKSSWGRKGLLVHATAGFCDPGFKGEITLELKNLTEQALILTPGQPIAQAVMFSVQDCTKGYGHPDYNSHYQNQKGATESAIDDGHVCPCHPSNLDKEAQAVLNECCNNLFEDEHFKRVDE